MKIVFNELPEDDIESEYGQMEFTCGGYLYNLECDGDEVKLRRSLPEVDENDNTTWETPINWINEENEKLHNFKLLKGKHI
jgi:hypothetical protein